MTTFRILIMAGGTGGHVFPGLAVAKKLREMGSEILWLGTREGLEADIVPKAGIPIHYLTIQGIRRAGVKSKLLAIPRLMVALYQALRVIREFKPDVVIGMGGFCSGPGGVAAWILRRPLVIHEQNSIAGVTNRLLALLAKKVLAGFPESFPNNGGDWVGNPVREEFSQIQAPYMRYKKFEKNTLLILGGSQGALALNRLIPKALQLIPAEKRPLIWHQVGKNHLEFTQTLYREVGVEARIDSFIDNVAEAYEWANLVICRAGALTVSELAACGVASILIPFPFAVDDHQTHNGRFLERVGAAKVISEANIDPKRLADMILSSFQDPSLLIKMAEAARGVSKPDALVKITSLCIEVCSESNSRTKATQP